MKRTQAKSLIVLTMPQPRTWKSLDEIIPAIEKSWRRAGDKRTPVELLAIRGPQDALRYLKRIARARALIITVMSAEIISAMVLLRKNLGVEAPWIIHLHGEAMVGGPIFWGLKDILRESDSFVCSCESEAIAMRLLFSKANCLVVPFALGKLKRPGLATAITTKISWVYVGRISEQKNLHALLLAMWLMKQTSASSLRKLEIYGNEDGYGSPNMGIQYQNYHLYLMSLSQNLGLEKWIKWKGFVPSAKLESEVLKRRHIFVSPSLHIHENFGVAAFASLSAGHLAVLSAWGGHLDLKREFPRAVYLVDAQRSEVGPVISLRQLKNQLVQATLFAESTRFLETTELYGVECVARKLRRSLATNDGDPKPLKPSPLLKRISSRRVARGWAFARAFESYGDPLARQFFQIHRLAPIPLRTITTRLLLPPWVRIEKGIVRVDDPHRGQWTLKAYRDRRQISVSTTDGKEKKLSTKLAEKLIRQGCLFETDVDL